jgi:uncharacterized protein YgiM (DUF1202 family)
LLFVISFAAYSCGERNVKEDAKSEIQDLANLPDQTRVYVTTAPTKVRTGPGTQFRTIADIGRDAKVNVVGKDGEWVLIVSKKGNAPGYIEFASVAKWSGETAKDSQSASVEGRYEALADTQIRSGPGLHYPVVASISRGTKLNVVEEDKGWLKVESKRGNKPGYVEASLTKPVPH